MASSLRRTIPNAVTGARLLLSLGVFVLLGPMLARTGEPDAAAGAIGIAACVLFAVAAATDALDGYLARAWGVVSPFGRVMDPFCDKFLILGSLVILTGPGLAPQSGVATWMVIAILGRELLVTSLRAVAESMGAAFPAESSGKWKMALQCIAIGVAIVAATRQPASAAWTAWASGWMWAATIFTLGTLIPYGRRGMRLLSQPSRGRDEP